MSGESAGAPRPLEMPLPSGEARTDAMRALVAVVDRLRAPDGCPWDREQTVASMAPSLVEEAFEALEAIEVGDDGAVLEELGDLLMVIVLIARIAEQGGRFDLADAARAVTDKLVRRHPHVFGSSDGGSAAGVDSSAHVVANWERIKAAERAAKKADASALAGVPVALPALQRANRLGAKAIAAGFRWADAQGALAKLEEEVREVRAVMASLEERGRSAEDQREPGNERGGDREALEHELGDVLLAAALLCNYVGVDAERAARIAVRRFETRFRTMEGEVGGNVRGIDLETLMRAWQRAKEREVVH